jgi:hypothetical protein
MTLLYRYIIKSLNATSFSHAAELKSKIIYDLFREMGYQIDTVRWTDRDYKPTRTYDVVFDIRHLHRLKNAFKPQTVKILYLNATDDVWRNRQERERVEQVNRRRGCYLQPKRQIKYPDSVYQSIEAADVVLLNGNEFTRRTYPERYWDKIVLADNLVTI